MEITIDYKNGETCPDEDILVFLKAQISFKSEFSIGSDLLLTGLRVLHIRGELDFNLLNVVDTEGNEYKIDNQGMLNNYPRVTILSDLLDEMLSYRLNFNKEEN